MNPSDSKKLEEIEARDNELYVFWTDTYDGKEAGVFYSADDDIGFLVSKVKEQDREIERIAKDYDCGSWKARAEKAEAEVKRLRGLERIVQQLVGEWNEFEHPMVLEWDMPDPMRTIHEWACDWYSRAEKAEARVKELEEKLGGKP